MLAPLRRRLSYANVVATLALFLAVSTGGAYAIDKWTGANVVDESLTGADVRGKSGTGTAAAVNGSLTTHDIAGQPANASNGTRLINGTLTQWDVRNGSLANADLADNTITGAKVANNSLKGSDIDESTLTSIGGGGPAGGGLTGTYPNPQIAPNAVGASEIAGRAVGAEELDLLNVVGIGTTVAPRGGVGEVVQTCPNGVRIGGGAYFEFPSGEISASYPGAGQTWVAEGQNNGAFPQDLTAWVVCLIP